MGTKIPDGILEKLYCDECYKFLSVKPVKVFPGKKILCGRCSNDEDEGVVSMYSLIADHYHFPCVNRYDGCDTLLDSSQVASHEESCKSRHYVCPICKDDKQIPSFLMIKHFRDRHKRAVLSTPTFCINPKESLQVEKWFLYKLDNILFFINCLLRESEDTVCLNARYLGVSNKSEIITQKFFLHYGSNRTPSGETLCLPYSGIGSMGLSVSMSSSDQRELITVCFEINISKVLLPKIPLTEQAQYDSISAQQVSISTQTTNSVSENERRQNASLIEMNSVYSEDDLIRHRKIYLTSSALKSFTIGPTIDVQNKNEIYLWCFNCEEIDSTKIFQCGQYVHDTIQINKKTYLKCFLCNILTKNTPVSSNQNTDVLRYDSKKIHLFCIWNCGLHFPFCDIIEHEIECDKQPSRLCPVKSCVMKGKLSEIKTHFKEHSPEYSLSFTSFLLLDLTRYELWQSQKVFLLLRNNVFVFVELTDTKGLWQLKCMLCGEKDIFAGLKLKAAVIDGLRNNIVGLIKQHQVLSFTYAGVVRMKCFLEKENPYISQK